MARLEVGRDDAAEEAHTPHEVLPALGEDGFGGGRLRLAARRDQRREGVPGQKVQRWASETRSGRSNRSSLEPPRSDPHALDGANPCGSHTKFSHAIAPLP